MTIIEKIIGNWLYLINNEAEENYKEINIELNRPNHGTIGKYLFFSDNKDELLTLGKELLVKYNLYNAKVPMSDTPNKSVGFGFVLCVYDSEPRFKTEFRQYGDNKRINYRYWKSDSDTLSGSYSKEYLDSKK